MQSLGGKARLGAYRITGTLGEGAMGVVYAAEHVALRRPAAIKVLRPSLSSNREQVERFFQEARATRRIRHPGLVDIFDFGHEDGLAFLVMERLDGTTLAARLRGGPLPFADVIAIGRQVASALQAAHESAIVHRDLKPDNLFLVPDEALHGGARVKVVDFGIAKLLDGGRSSITTRTGTVMGTPAYMSPEQCRSAADVDARSDIYSLGCVLFEMATGRRPFERQGLGEMIAAHLYLAPPSVRAIVPSLPLAFEALVARALDKDPASRQATMTELRAELELAAAAPAIASTVKRGACGGRLLVRTASRPARPSQRERATADEIADELLALDGPPLAASLARLGRLLDAAVGSYRVTIGEGGPDVRDVVTDRMPCGVNVLRDSLREVLRAKGRFALFDLRPTTAQRNRALVLAEAERIDGRPAGWARRSAAFARWGVTGWDQLRVLVCDGESVLAWVGGFRDVDFGPRERQLLQRLVPALRHRFVLERQFARARFAVNALDATLAALAAPAFVVGPGGNVDHRNAAGAALLAIDPEAREELRQAARGRPTRFDATRLFGGGAHGGWLLVLRAGTLDPGASVDAAAACLALTVPEREALRLVALGHPDETMSVLLGRSAPDVGAHVAALAGKAGAASRAELAATVWSTEPRSPRPPDRRRS